MATFKKKLKTVWKQTDKAARFVPRSKGGTSWGVFDKTEDRFLEDGEVKKMAVAELRDARVFNLH